MHVRFSMCRGLSVLEDGTAQSIGELARIFIHPDTGHIEGFFVRMNDAFSDHHLFLRVEDIVRWGKHVWVRRREALAPAEDLVRLRELLRSGRTVLGQRIKTEGGKAIGRCRDIQFNSETFMLEWLFPRKFFFWGTPISMKEVVIVQPDAVIVRELSVPIAESSPQELYA